MPPSPDKASGHHLRRLSAQKAKLAGWLSAWAKSPHTQDPSSALALPLTPGLVEPLSSMPPSETSAGLGEHLDVIGEVVNMILMRYFYQEVMALFKGTDTTPEELFDTRGPRYDEACNFLKSHVWEYQEWNELLSEKVPVGKGRTAGMVYGVPVAKSDSIVDSEQESPTYDCLKLIPLSRATIIELIQSDTSSKSPREKALDLHSTLNRVIKEQVIQQRLSLLRENNNFTLFKDYWFQETERFEDDDSGVTRISLLGIVIRMEHLTTSLADLMRAHGALLASSPTLRLCLFMKLLDGLRGMHSNLITHGDIKPDNILLKLKEVKSDEELSTMIQSPDAIEKFPFIVKITDFGLSNSINPHGSSYKKYYKSFPFIHDDVLEEHEANEAPSGGQAMSTYSRNWTWFEFGQYGDVKKAVFVLMGMALNKTFTRVEEISKVRHEELKGLTGLERRLCVLVLDAVKGGTVKEWEKPYVNRVQHSSFVLLNFVNEYLKRHKSGKGGPAKEKKKSTHDKKRPSSKKKADALKTTDHDKEDETPLDNCNGPMDEDDYYDKTKVDELKKRRNDAIKKRDAAIPMAPPPSPLDGTEEALEKINLNKDQN